MDIALPISQGRPVRRSRRLTALAGIVAVGTVWAAFAAAPAGALALEVPTVASVTPNEGGSAGGLIVAVKGTHFEEVGKVRFGATTLTKNETRPLHEGQFKVKSATEIEADTPSHPAGTVHVTVTNSAGTSAETATDEFTYLFEVYKEEAALGTSRAPALGAGQLEFIAPQLSSSVACVSLGDGVAWNEGSPVRGHGEILAWNANSHLPEGEHSEISSRCRFVFHGIEENQPASPTAWVTSEPRLHTVIQEGEVCAERSAQELSECPNAFERERTEVIREVNREPSTPPWNMQFTEKEGRPRVQIGVPDECKGKSGEERNELSKCPQPSEREAGTNPAACDASAGAPPGCVKVTVVSNAPLNLDLQFEGYLEPAGTNGAGRGPASSLKFEAGHEPALHLKGVPSTALEVSGLMKILGFENQELLTVK